MKIKNEIFLPGGVKQLELLRQNVELNGKDILIMGSGAEDIAESIAVKDGCNVFLIVEDQDSLITSRLKLAEHKNAVVRLMDYSLTDFKEEQFDIVYAQGAISVLSRNKIVKEIKRILKPEGYLCVGEITGLTKEIPRFIKDVWERSSLAPLFIEELEKYYTERKFKKIAEKDFSIYMFGFYRMCEFLSVNKTPSVSEEEKRYYKTILNKLSHEANVYLKQGGDKHIGFYVLLMQKES
jgi:Methylase involved in ubiquinone/menaquinone biosynthesis